MAERFLAMGYPPEQFYNDDESLPATFLQDELQKKGHSLLYLSIFYLTFLEPLTGISEEEKKSIKKAFEEYEGGAYKEIFNRIDEIINNWIHDDAYDAETYMIEFLTNAGVTDSWISYQKDIAGMYEEHFPDGGFFVGNPFTLEEIGKVYGY